MSITYQSGGSGAIEESGANCVVSGLSWTAGWLVVATGSIYPSGTPGISDSNNNTWTQCQSYQANATEAQWYTIVTNGGSGITVTFGTVGASETGTFEVCAFSSSAGWLSSPVDQKSQATTSSASSLTATNSAANSQAVELALFKFVSGLANGFSNFSSGYTSIQATTYAGCAYKATSAVETSSCQVTVTGNTMIDALLTTFRTAFVPDEDFGMRQPPPAADPTVTVWG